jgi:LacI family transcriptional regulator
MTDPKRLRVSEQARVAVAGPATQYEVARLAGVHRATVSRALDPARRDLLDPATLARVLAAVESLGYRPNALARGLKTSRSGTTGLIVPDLSSPEVSIVVGACETRIRDAGYSTLVMSSGDDAQGLAAASEQLMASRAEGVIVVTSKRADFVLPALGLDGTPVVIVGPPDDAFPTVSIDNQLGAERAVEHLIRLGHRRIGLICEGQNTTRGAAHVDGYRVAMSRAGIGVDERLVQIAEPSRPASGVEACAALFHRGVAPTAILATSDETALGCYAALAEFGLGVPDDVSVVGYGNSAYGRYFSPPLTTVSLPLAAAGYAAAARLLAQLGAEGEIDSDHVHVTPYLVQRLSTRHAAITAVSEAQSER